MLFTAMKNELRQEARRYLLFLGVLLAAALLGGIAQGQQWLASAGAQQGAGIVALALIAAFWLMTLLVTVRRFDPAAPDGEGPDVSGSRHNFIQSRLGAAVIWNMAGGALSLLALLPLADTATVTGQLGGAVKGIGLHWSAQPDMLLSWGGIALSGAMVLLMLLVYLLNLTLLLYMCRCISLRFDKLRWLILIVTFAAIAAIQMLIGGIPLLVFAGAVYYYAVYRLIGDRPMPEVMSVVSGE